MKTYNYLCVNIALAAGLVISRFYFQDSLLEKFFRMSFDLTLTLSVVLEAYRVHRLERIKNSKDACSRDNSRIADDIIGWRKSCKSIVSRFWDYVLIFPLLVYFMLTMQWAEFIAMIAYQAIKAVVAWEIKEINGARVKLRKDEAAAKNKEETGVQALVQEIDGEKVEA